jgi:hypothetical protein
LSHALSGGGRSCWLVTICLWSGAPDRRWRQGARRVPLGIGPGVHDRLVQGRRLLEHDIGAKLVAEPHCEELDLVIFGDGRVPARKDHELSAVILDGPIPAKQGQLIDWAFC